MRKYIALASAGSAGLVPSSQFQWEQEVQHCDRFCAGELCAQDRRCAREQYPFRLPSCVRALRCARTCAGHRASGGTLRRTRACDRVRRTYIHSMLTPKCLRWFCKVFVLILKEFLQKLVIKFQLKADNTKPPRDMLMIIATSCA